MLDIKNIFYCGTLSSILFLAPAGATPLAEEIKTMIAQHETMSDKAIIELAQHIIEVSVPESVKPYDGLTAEQAQAAAEIFAQTGKKHSDYPCTGCNITPPIHTDPLVFAIDILMDYAHPENYYR